MAGLYGCFIGLLGTSAVFLFLVSLVIEGFVFSKLLGNIWLGFALATAFELTKLVSVIGKPLLLHATSAALGYFHILLPLLRIGLVFLSVSCSVVFLAYHVDKPTLGLIRSADLSEFDDMQSRELRALENHYQQQLAQWKSTFAESLEKNIEAIVKQYKPRILELETLLVSEMDNVVNGVFIGPRYVELQRRLEDNQLALSLKLAELHTQASNSEETRLVELEENYLESRQLLLDSLQEKRDALLAKTYNDDNRVSLPIVRATRNLLYGAFSIHVPDLTIGLYLSILVSCVGEIALLCMLGFLGEISRKILQVQFDIWQYTLLVQNETQSEVETYRNHSSATMNSVVRDRRRLEKEAASLQKRAL